MERVAYFHACFFMVLVEPLRKAFTFITGLITANVACMLYIGGRDIQNSICKAVQGDL